MDDSLQTLNVLHHRLSETNGKIRHFISENESLRKTLEEVENQYSSLSNSLKSKKSAVLQRNSHAAHEQKKMEQIQVVLEELDSKAVSLMGKKKTARTKSLMDRMLVAARIAKCTDHYWSKFQDWDAHIPAIPSELKNTTSQLFEIVDALQKQLCVVDAPKKTAPLTPEEREARMATLNKEVDTAEAEVEALRAQLDALKAAKQAREEESAKKKASISGDDALEAAKAECEALDGEIKEAKQDIETLHEDIAKSNALIDDLEGDIEAWHRKAHTTNCISCSQQISPKNCSFCALRSSS